MSFWYDCNGNSVLEAYNNNNNNMMTTTMTIMMTVDKDEGRWILEKRFLFGCCSSVFFCVYFRVPLSCFQSVVISREIVSTPSKSTDLSSFSMGSNWFPAVTGVITAFESDEAAAVITWAKETGTSWFMTTLTVTTHCLVNIRFMDRWLEIRVKVLCPMITSNFWVALKQIRIFLCFAGFWK